jgi:hypothetical protein
MEVAVVYIGCAQVNKHTDTTEEDNVADSMSYMKKAGKNAKHLTWVDQIKSGFQPPEERADYLANQANMRAREAEEEAKRKKSGG